ncbi:helix-turn-helix domain-containing protein [Streptomyces atratus]
MTSTTAVSRCHVPPPRFTIPPTFLPRDEINISKPGHSSSHMRYGGPVWHVPARVAERARIVLACAEGASNTRVPADFRVSTETVRKWRSRFADRRMAGLVDEPRPGRHKSELVLIEAERAELTRWSRRAKTAQFLALRAEIVLRCAEGGTNKETAAELGIAHATVNRWHSRSITLRLDGLTDEPRPGRPPSVLLGQVEPPTTTPPVASLCPPMYLVAECTTRSAPIEARGTRTWSTRPR